MKHLTTTFLTVILATLSFYAQLQGNTPVKAVDSVDLNKYAGKWYEIARYIPTNFKRNVWAIRRLHMCSRAGKSSR